jgi:hypothetical protein
MNTGTINNKILLVDDDPQDRENDFPMLSLFAQDGISPQRINFTAGSCRSL